MTTAFTIVICINRRHGINNPSCAGRGSEAIAEELEKQLAELGLDIEVRGVKCLGQCELGPNLRIAPGERFFHHLTPDQLPAVIAEIVRLSENNSY
jgi:NADH:ubiquinone oxidoreductase subunit E